MKYLLLFSVLLNGVLLILAGRHLAVAISQHAPTITETGVEAPAVSALASDTSEADSAPITPWAGIDSTDPRQLIARLRAIGCPEGTLRDIVVTRVCRAYRSKLLALETDASRAWDVTKGMGRGQWREIRRQQSRLRHEMKSELETLLNQPADRLTTGLMGWPDRSNLVPLPTEKRIRIGDIQQDYRERIQELQERRIRGIGVGPDPESEAEIAKLRRQEQSEIDAVLSPAEREERLYRESAAAKHVREKMPAAKTEAEFRQIVRLAAEVGLGEAPRGSVARSYGLVGLPGEETVMQEHDEREATFDRRLKEVLGEKRIAEREAEERTRQVELQVQLSSEAAKAAGVAPEEIRKFYRWLLENRPENQAAISKSAVEILGEKGSEFLRILNERDGSR